MDKTLIRADFDHMLSNHFLSVNACHAINKTMLFVIFVKIHINTCYEPEFTRFKILIKNLVGGQLACALQVPAGQVRRESYLPERKVSLSQRSGRGFFRALIVDHAQVFLCKKRLLAYFSSHVWWTDEFTIHILGLLFKNATSNVNWTFNYGVPFFANITSAVHHTFHFKLSKTTADDSLTLSSSLAATLCFVTWLWEQSVSSQTRMTVALSNVNLVSISSIFETAIR